MTKRVIHVVTNVDRYESTGKATGLWLSELTHAWGVFEANGFSQTLVSPNGGSVPLEPRSLKWPALDGSAKRWLDDPIKMAMLQDSASPEEIDPDKFDAIYYTGGHAVMYDFPEHNGLQKLATQIWTKGGVVSSVCHGYCGLLKIPDGSGQLIIKDRAVTGFSWTEEILAGVAKIVPYNVEQCAKDRGAKYEKTWMPFKANVVTDGRLVTGQNPASASATAKAVVIALAS